MPRIQTPKTPTTVEEYPFGWRYEERRLSNGKTELVQIPLTIEQALYPEEDYVIPQNTYQFEMLSKCIAQFKERAKRLIGGLLLSDVIIHWNVPGVRNHSPDLVVFQEVFKALPENGIGTFSLKKFGGIPVVVVEIVSLSTRINDVEHKLRDYHKVGIPQYIIIDQEGTKKPRKLVAYEWDASRYRKIKGDRRGRILIEPLGLLMGLREGEIVLHDAETGKEVEDYGALTEAREREEEARIRAEQARNAEADARIKAEQARNTEADARIKAEQARNTEADARIKAEQARNAESDARIKAERRIVELETLLQKLKEK